MTVATIEKSVDHQYSPWLDFAERGGYRNVARWGHSLGAVKTIYYLAQVPEQRAACAITASFSPGRWPRR
jgi:hypothetical protein